MKPLVDLHIVDDEIEMRNLYSSIVNAFNYQAMLFCSADEYLEYMISPAYLPPQLAVLTDVDMPKMSGYELMRDVRNLVPHQRFLIVTGSPNISTLDNYSCFYLTKPFHLKKFSKILEALALCRKDGAQPEIIQCASIDDRCNFCVSGWKCPQSGT